MKKRETVGLTQSQADIKASLAIVGHQKELHEIRNLEHLWASFQVYEATIAPELMAKVTDRIDRKKAELAGVPFYEAEG